MFHRGCDFRISGNVIWLDEASAARAILGLSKKIIGVKKEPNRTLNSDDDSQEESDDDIYVNGEPYREGNSVHIKDLRCPLPPGIWRKGQDYNDSRNILLRFATRSDRKLLQGINSIGGNFLYTMRLWNCFYEYYVISADG